MPDKLPPASAKRNPTKVLSGCAIFARFLARTKTLNHTDFRADAASQSVVLSVPSLLSSSASNKECLYMNRVYKVVFNRALGCSQVVPEAARCAGRTAGR